MSNQRKSKGILIYNLLLKEVTRINKLLPEDRKLSLKERRTLISEKIYPKYKDQARSRIRLTPLREKLINTIRRIPRKIGCDVLAIEKNTYQDIPYFEIESFISDVLPKCIFVKIEAGSAGATNIFSTRDFDYYKTGLSEITNRLNEKARQLNKNTSNIPEYKGYIKLLPNRKNDGNPDNYYLEMIISWHEKRPPKQIEIPYKKKTKTQKKKEENIKKHIHERLKTLRNQKSIFKPIRKYLYKNFRLVELFEKNRIIKKDEKIKFKKTIHKSLKEYVKNKFDEGKLTERKYKFFIKEINTFFKKR